MVEAGPDRQKLREKIQFIRDTLRQLEGIRDDGRDAFLAGKVPQYAAVRCIQVAVEAVLDSANHIIAREGLGLPKTYAGSVRLLVEAGILPPDKKGYGGRYLLVIPERDIVAVANGWNIFGRRRWVLNPFIDALLLATRTSLGAPRRPGPTGRRS